MARTSDCAVCGVVCCESQLVSRSLLRPPKRFKTQIAPLTPRSAPHHTTQHKLTAIAQPITLHTSSAMPQSLNTPTVTPTKPAAAAAAEQKEHTPEKLALAVSSPTAIAPVDAAAMDKLEDEFSQRTHAHISMQAQCHRTAHTEQPRVLRAPTTAQRASPPTARANDVACIDTSCSHHSSLLLALSLHQTATTKCCCVRTPVASCCSRSSTMRSGRCTRSTKQRSGKHRKWIWHMIRRTGRRSRMMRSTVSDTHARFKSAARALSPLPRSILTVAGCF